MTTSELLERLAATPKLVAQLVADAGDARLDAAPPGEWSARTIIAHLRDNESLVGRLRIERMMVEDNPQFVLVEPEPWAIGRNRERDRKQTLLADFALQRQATVTLLQGLRPEEWKRTGRHPVQGTMTIEAWATFWLNHDDNHLRQLEQVLGETVAEARQRLRETS